MSKSKMVRAAGLIIFITLISKAIGFLRDTLVASSFGATYQTDAYNMSITFSEILFSVFSLAITTTFIPLLSEIYKKKSKEEMFDFANNVMNILLLISGLLCILGWTFAEQLVRVIAPKFTGEAFELTVKLARISVVSLIFMSMDGGYTALLQTLDDFMAPSLVGIMMNFPLIIYILSGAKGGVVGLAVATVLGNALRVVVQIPWLIKNGYSYKFKFNIKDERFKTMVMLILPVIVGAGVRQLNAIIDKAIGSGLPEGSISALNFSSRITDIVYVTFATAIVTVVYPALSREGSAENFNEFKNYIVKAVNNISIIMIPCTAGLMILSQAIIVVLFKHGVFDDRAVSMTVQGLIFYSVGIPFYGIRDVFNRSLYALKDTKTSTVNGIIGILLNIVLNLTLVRFMGLGGLALATSISAIITTFLLLISLKKRIGAIGRKEILITNTKVVVASAVMSVGVYAVYIGLRGFISGFNGELLGLILSTAAGVIIYTIMLVILKVNEFKTIMNGFIAKFKR